MGLINWLNNLFTTDQHNASTEPLPESSTENLNTINPATGLPMIGGTAGVDTEGNPYGTDLNSTDDLNDTLASNTFDDDIFDNDDTFGNSFDDPFDDPFSDDW